MEHSSINTQEVKKFTELANEWWKPNGKFKTLHKFNPSRLGFIIRNIKSNFSISDDVIVSETGFSRLNNNLRQKGFIVEEVKFNEIAKMEGLLRCTTLPLIRE